MLFRSIELNVTSAFNGFLILSEIHYPGWHAYVDGREVPLYRADWCLRALPLDHGPHRVEVRFEPETFWHGLLITSATLLVSVIGIAGSLIRRRKGRSSPEGSPEPEKRRTATDSVQ